ncbi:hypothetical protein JI57_00780 [Psychromonas sp. PRT-SC03]|nr:hypothetical protein JI57_00780 [Psychromonas sp. PRT-SC03]
MLLKYKLMGLSTLFLLGACSSNTIEETSVGDIPSWILNPQVEEGIAVTECVLFSGNMSIDKQQALANARTALAQRIETRVSALDKSYREKIEVKTGVQSGSTFSSVSKLVTEQVLVGTTPLKMDITKIAGKDNLCVLMGIGESSTKVLFENLVKKADRPLNANQEDVLYQEFKAKRANDELNFELEKAHK